MGENIHVGRGLSLPFRGRVGGRFGCFAGWFGATFGGAFGGAFGGRLGRLGDGGGAGGGGVGETNKPELDAVFSGHGWSRETGSTCEGRAQTSLYMYSQPPFLFDAWTRERDFRSQWLDAIWGVAIPLKPFHDMLILHFSAIFILQLLKLNLRGTRAIVLLLGRNTGD